MMTPEKKLRSLTFIIAFLLLTNISMVLFFVFSKPCCKTPPPKDENLVGTFLREEMKFDEKQLDLYQQIRKNDFEKARPLLQDLSESKNIFYQNIHRNDVPDSIIKKSARVIGKRQIAVDMQMLQHFRNVRSICTPQQLPKFDSTFKTVIAKITAGRLRRK
jgi:protein CpxP